MYVQSIGHDLMLILMLMIELQRRYQFSYVAVLATRDQEHRQEHHVYSRKRSQD